MSAPEERPRQVRAADILRPTFRRFFWDSYDHIGTLVLANLLWLALCLPVVTAPAATAGLFHMARKIANREPAGPRDVLVGFRMHFVPVLKAGALMAGLAVLIWVNTDFYSRLGGRVAIPGMFVAGVLIWSAAFLVLMNAHVLPLIVSGDRSLKSVLKKSALLTLDNIGFTIGITVQAIMVAALCVLTGAGLVLVIGSLMAVLLTTGHHELLKRYFPPKPGEEEPPERRTLRHLVRPWESSDGRS